MKRSISAIIFFLFIFLCISCAKTTASASDHNTNPSNTIIPTSSLAQDAAEVTALPNSNASKPLKNGFDTTTNAIYTFSHYSISVPTYYIVKEETENALKLVTASVDPDAIFIIGATDLVATQEDFYKDRASLTQALSNMFNDSEIVSDEATLVANMTAIRTSGTGTTDGNPISFIGIFALDTTHNKLILFVFVQKVNSMFDYSADAERTTQSISFLTENKPITDTPVPTTAPTPAPTAEPKKGEISYDSFQKVKTGMSLDDVKAILGDDPVLTSSSEIAGVKAEIYSWKGSGFSSITITFTNGKVSGRGQAGLNEKTKPVSAAQFSEIKNGMTYEQVVKIMGSDGYITSESSIMGITVTIYQWDGNGIMSTAIVTFQNEKVISMSQYGLS